MGLPRRLLASLSLGASAVGFATMAGWDKAVVIFTGCVALGALALGRRSVSSQVFGRSVAWLILAPSAIGVGDALWHGRLPDGYAALLAVTSAAALVLARPALHTAEARAEFDPARYRRLFLAGAVSAGMTGLAAAFFALEAMWWGAHGPGLAFGALAAALLASAAGVVRMRAWGVLLAIVTSVGALGAALLTGDHALALGLALAALPGALLASPLAIARLRPESRARGASRGDGLESPATAPELRVADDATPAVPALRARVDAGGCEGAASDGLAVADHASAHSK
jgi:hypothetical protein